MWQKFARKANLYVVSSIREFEVFFLGFAEFALKGLLRGRASKVATCVGPVVGPVELDGFAVPGCVWAAYRDHGRQAVIDDFLVISKFFLTQRNA